MDDVFLRRHSTLACDSRLWSCSQDVYSRAMKTTVHVCASKHPVSERKHSRFLNMIHECRVRRHDVPGDSAAGTSTSCGRSGSGWFRYLCRPFSLWFDSWPSAGFLPSLGAGAAKDLSWGFLRGVRLCFPGPPVRLPSIEYSGRI